MFVVWGYCVGEKDIFTELRRVYTLKRTKLDVKSVKNLKKMVIKILT